MTTPKALRLVETYPDKPQAEDAMLTYAKLLVQRGDTDRFGVFVERVTLPRSAPVWGVYLLDRQYAPSRKAARAGRKRGVVNDE